MWIISNALMKDYENSLSLQVRAVESLAGNCSDGEQSVLLNTNPMPQVYLSQDRTTEAYRRFQSLMTSETLTEDRGEDLLTWYRADFLAQTFQSPEKEKVSQERTLDSGKKWHACFGRYNQDSRLLKTAQLCLIEDSMSCLSTLPNQGLMLRGELLAQKPLEQDISAIGFGVSPDGETFFHTQNTGGLDGGSNSRRALKKRQMIGTPTACMSVRSSKFSKGRIPNPAEYVLLEPENLRDQVSNMDNWQMFPTPQTRGFTNDGDLLQLAKVCDNFEEMSAMAYRAAHKKKAGYWPTPTSSNGGSNNNSKSVKERGHGTNLVGAVAKFPTPTVFGNYNQKGMSATSGDGLATFVGKFPTPCARDYKDGHFLPETKEKRDAHSRGKPLSEYIGGRLNPDWVELLMLWPKHWTSLEQSPDMDNWGSTDDDWEEGTPRVTSNCPNRAARLRAIGNGQTPACVAAAWQLLMKRFEGNS